MWFDHHLLTDSNEKPPVVSSLRLVSPIIGFTFRADSDLVPVRFTIDERDVPTMERPLRVLTSSTPHTSYLKISEGCDHTCAFCAIPLMRGLHRSQPLDALVAEARSLGESGVRELNVISQDTTWYGRDLRRKDPSAPLLPELLRALVERQPLQGPPQPLEQHARADDEGGPMTNGANHAGSIPRGDLDQWTFDATAGDVIDLTITEISDDGGFAPWIRLLASTGQLLASHSGTQTARIDIKRQVAPGRPAGRCLRAAARTGRDGRAVRRVGRRLLRVRAKRARRDAAGLRRGRAEDPCDRAAGVGALGLLLPHLWRVRRLLGLPSDAAP